MVQNQLLNIAEHTALYTINFYTWCLFLIIKVPDYTWGYWQTTKMGYPLVTKATLLALDDN